MRFAACLVVLVSFAALAREPFPLSEDEFKMYLHYKQALADERVQAMKADKRLAAIARDSGYKLKELEKVVAKGNDAGDLKARCEGNLKEAFTAGELAGRAGRLELDATGAHAVAYVQWFNEKPELLTQEASVAAALASDACPIATSIQVWANDKAHPKARVFQALISGAGAGRIKLDKVKDFAETRYIKLFEKVKSVVNGDDLSAETTATAAVPAAPAKP